MGRIIKSQGHVERAPVMAARDQAAAIVSRALRDADAVRSGVEATRIDARRAGHAEGLAAGRDEALAQVTALLVSARLDAEDVRREAKGTCLALARRMAEKIIGAAAALAPTVLEGIVVDAVAESRAKTGAVIVRVHPADLENIQGRSRSIVARANPGLSISFMSDESVDRQGCIVDTRIGRVDARLASQLDALEKAVRPRAESGPDRGSR